MLLLWPIGLAMILLRDPLRKTDKRKCVRAALLFWGLTGTAVWVAYFADYQKPVHHPGLLYGCHHPLEFLEYVCLYVSNPLGLGKSGRIIGGAILLLLYLGSAVLACWRWRKGNPLPVMPLGMILFVMGIALITTVARAGFGPGQALTRHYQTFSGLGLVGLYLLFLSLHKESGLRVRNYDVTNAVWGALLLLMVIFICRNAGAGRGAQTRADRTMMAYYLSTFPLQSDRTLKKVYAETSRVRQAGEFLRSIKFNVFASPPLEFAHMRQVEEKDLPHTVDLFMGQPVPDDSHAVVIGNGTDTVSVAGRAEDKAAKAAAGAVFIEVDGQMDVPAACGLPRPDVAKRLAVPYYHYSGFAAEFSSGFLKEGRHTLRVKVVSADKKSYTLSAEKLILDVH